MPEPRARCATPERHASSCGNSRCGRLAPQFVPDSGRYVLLKPLRPLVTVNVPSACADTLIQWAVPLCWGAGAAWGPCGGAIGPTGIAGCWLSNELAMKTPGTVYSCPP